MKANKALKRLAKIETLMSDVAERFSASAPHLREALKDLKAAVLSVKEAVKVQTSTAPKKASPKKAARAAKKAAVKKAAAPKAKAAKKRAPRRKAAKKISPARVAAAASSPQSIPAAAPHAEP
ncbi:MAG: hypothetical protein M3N41_09535 [Acidobacteriota bacterium]|nr:hypothetical protein [Acidobacteriota bacterium]